MAVDQIGTASTVIPQRVVAFKGEPESTPVAYQPRESSSGSGGVNALLGLTALAAVVVAGLALHKSGKAATAVEELAKKAGKTAEEVKPGAAKVEAAKTAEAAKAAEVASAKPEVVAAAAPNVRTANVIKAEHDVAKAEYEAAAKQLKDAAPNYEANPDGVAELAERATTKKAAYEKLAKELETKEADDLAGKTLDVVKKENEVAKTEYEAAVAKHKEIREFYASQPDGVKAAEENIKVTKAALEKSEKAIEAKMAQLEAQAKKVDVTQAGAKARHEAAVVNLRNLAPQYATKPVELAAAKKEVADAYTALKAFEK